MVKVTYSLDETTVHRIRRIAERLGKAQSQVVREAVADYAARADRLSEVERLRMLKVIDGIREAKPTRSREATGKEQRTLRAARRTAWRRETGT